MTAVPVGLRAGLSSSATINLTNDTFNSFANEGIEVYNPSSTAIISGSTITGATSSGPLYDIFAAFGANATVSDTTIYGGQYGAAASNLPSDSTPTEITLTSDTIEYATTAGIYALPNPPLPPIMSSPPQPVITANFDRIVDNAVGVDNGASNTISATNDWWGSNSGPGSGAISGSVTTSPYLVLEVSASTTTAVTGQPVTITADLTYNSSGTDTSSSGYLPDGTPVDFVAMDGIVPPANTTTNGQSSATLTVGGVGTSAGAVTVDGVSAITPGITVSPDSTTISVTSSANPSVYGQPVTLTATVSAVSPGSGIPPGTVQFQIDGINYGPKVTVNGSGQATIAAPMLTVGSHTVTAIYSGDSNYAPSGDTGSPLNQAVTTDGTSTTLISSSAPAVFGQLVTFTATIAASSPGAGIPSGTVTFYDGSTSLGTGTLAFVGGYDIATLSTSTLAVGDHANVTAVYGGDVNFLTSTSSALDEDVNKDGTSTTIGVSANPSVFGQNVTFIANVLAAAPGSGMPTGTVQFQIDGSNYGSPVTLNGSGQASISDSALSVATHTVTANYSGDSDFNTSTDSSSPLDQEVDKDPTKEVLTSSASPAEIGTSITFTAIVTANTPGSGTPTGTVEFFDGATELGTGTLSGGVASFSTSALTAGSHFVIAEYEGDVNFVSALAAIPEIIDLASTTTLTSSANPSVFGQSVTFTATVAPSVGSGTPTGTVGFYDGSTLLGLGTLSGVGGYDVANYSTSALALGDHPSITAQYSGDSTYYTSTSSALDQEVDQDDTVIALSASPTSPVYGQSVTLVASVSANSPGSGTPTGTVTFYDGTTSLGSTSLSAGVATISTSALSLGDHTAITAVYSGNTDFITNTSSAATVDVSQDFTTTNLVTSVSPSVYGQNVTFTAMVTANSPGSGTPSGTVTFYDGVSTLGTSSLNGSGVAAFSTSALAVGDHPFIIAVYNGSADFVMSLSKPVDQDVDQASTTITLAALPDLAVYGQPVTFTATVSVNSPGSGNPSGTVTFYDGGTSIGTGSLSVVGGYNVATLTISSLAAGDHPTLTASYAGSTDFSSSTSGDLDLSVAAASWTSNPTPDPTIVAPSINPTTMEGATVDLSIEASDPSDYSLTYAAINLPAGLSIGQSSGVISGTVAYNTAATFGGVYNPTIVVSDGEGGTANLSFTWTITPTTQPPVLALPANQTNAVGGTITPLQLSATYVDSVPLTYTAKNLPAGLSINASTGLITGTLAPGSARSDSYTVIVSASAQGTTASQVFYWTVNEANLTPQLGNPGNQVNTAGDIVLLPLSANSPDGSVLSFRRRSRKYSQRGAAASKLIC